MCLQNSNNFKLTSKLKVIFCNLLNYTQRLDVTKTSSLLLFVNQKDAIEMESELDISALVCYYSVWKANFTLKGVRL